MKTGSQPTVLVHVCISDNPQMTDLNPVNLVRLGKLTSLELLHKSSATQTFTFSQFMEESFVKRIDAIDKMSEQILFEYSCGFRPFSTLREFPWGKIPGIALSIEFEGMSKADTQKFADLLKSAGWNRTGIGIRATSTDALFLRANKNSRAQNQLVEEARRSAGRTFVRVRDRITHLTKLPKEELSPINPRGKEITHFRIRESEAIASTLNAQSTTQFHVPVLAHNNQYDLANECFEEFGVKPISFSFPESLSRTPVPPIHSISPVIPGHAYSYNSPDEYFRQYSESALAITHRKAGWDCFRHVEILAAGSVPLMLDSKEIPKFSMIHYPKAALTQVAENVQQTRGTPDQTTQLAFRQYFEQNLTTKVMATYLLESAGLHDAQKILFVDRSLPALADYQSVLTLIGLKELLGQSCSVVFPVDYIYNDWQGSGRELYGRGFGYTRSVDATSRTRIELDVLSSKNTPPAQPGFDNKEKYDAVVIGNIALNTDLAVALLNEFPTQKTIWIHGGDSPPNQDLYRLIKDSGTQAFIRAINV